MVASPLDYPGGHMFSFLRRQYFVARHYAPLHWAMALCGATVGSLALLGSAAMCLWGAVPGGFSPWLPALILSVVYGLSVFRAYVRQDLVRTYFPSLRLVFHKARRVDICAAPLAGLVHWAGIVGSLFGHEMVWRGIRYRLTRDGTTAIIHGSGQKESVKLNSNDQADRSFPLRKAG
jgi:hypothetical protein